MKTKTEKRTARSKPVRRHTQANRSDRSRSSVRTSKNRSRRRTLPPPIPKRKSRREADAFAELQKELRRFRAGKGESRVLLIVAKRSEPGIRSTSAHLSWPPIAAKTRSSKSAKKPRIKDPIGVAQLSGLCRTLAAIGHPQRARILIKLLDGPGTHRSLARCTRLKAGPLYHHVDQLRLARLVDRAERDLYTLTDKGRTQILTILTFARLARP